ncbi:TPA: hypothetical protein DCZ15_01190 [Candidatus Falkowbacteria bacterium]|nr:MAG: Peptidase M22 glycoprotease [Candidatus Falkowbacteria bacterium GW2011_GWF2_43_32]HBA36471.1 hypothetical protein [Candidatus Falkowbacteria bacterium]
MILYINTAGHDEIVIALYKSGFVADSDSLAVKPLARRQIKAPRQQAEKLLPAIARMLASKKIKLSALKKIVVANRGGSFTSLRIGVITANALAYALKIPVEAEARRGKKNKKFAAYSIVEPIYDREPIIGIAKKLLPA